MRNTASGSDDPFGSPYGSGADFRNGSSRSTDDDDGSPQFLVEADDLYGDDNGESRLVAPPVIGEAPSMYRDL